nr:nicotinate (nicotinamide) nucleotide adenylyltransferase [Desulfobulbus alkaliphilus]
MFGGTFDPVHKGHLLLARLVLDRCRLNTLLFIPAPQPPHKRQPLVSFGHRAAMLTAALADWPERHGMELSLIEASLPAPSYTINTVEALRQQYGPQRFLLVIGADSLLDLPQWHRAPELLNLISLIVVQRDAIEREAIEKTLRTLDPHCAWNEELQLWQGTGEYAVEFLADVELPVSSSAIREDLLQGRSPDMLPAAVLAYIKRHHLYGWLSQA